MWKFPSLYQRVEGNYVTRNREFMGQEGCVTKPCYFFIDLLVAAVVQSLSPVQFLATPWTEARQATLSFIISLSLFKLMSIESVMPCNHLILCHPLLLPSIFPSIRLSFLQWVGSSHQVAKVLELQLWHQSFQWIFKVDFL